MTRTVHVSGVGMVPFTKPSAGHTYEQMGAAAARAALADAGLRYDLIEQAYVGYVYGDSTSGQRALYEVGTTAIPVVNVNNNCATGSSALWLARQAVATGAAECVLALGFEQMAPGAISAQWQDRPFAMGPVVDVAHELQGPSEAPLAAQLFGGAGAAYRERFDTPLETFASVSVKSRAHARHNPYAVFRDPLTVEEVLSSPHLYGPLTRLQACPPTSGGAAAIVCSAEFVDRHELRKDVVIRGQSLVTDPATSYDPPDMTRVVGYDMTVAAATEVYEATGIGPEDVPVVELHDCFTANEILTYEALGLTPEGTAERFIADGDNTYGGRVVTNPSGGLLSKGHPLGATGLAQCAELVWQLRGDAGDRQVEGVGIGLQHNLGLGGACVVTMFEKVA